MDDCQQYAGHDCDLLNCQSGVQRRLTGSPFFVGHSRTNFSAANFEIVSVVHSPDSAAP
jgi:hypothetical protein